MFTKWTFNFAYEMIIHRRLQELNERMHSQYYCNDRTSNLDVIMGYSVAGM